MTAAQHAVARRRRAGWMLLGSYVVASGAVAAYTRGILSLATATTVTEALGTFTAAIAGACADVDHGYAQAGTRLGQHAKPPQPCGTLFGVRMAHVEGALHGGDRDVA